MPVLGFDWSVEGGRTGHNRTEGGRGAAGGQLGAPMGEVWGSVEWGPGRVAVRACVCMRTRVHGVVSRKVCGVVSR